MDFSCSVPSQLGTGHDFDRVYEHMWKVLARGNDYLEFDGIVDHVALKLQSPSSNTHLCGCPLSTDFALMVGVNLRGLTEDKAHSE